MEPQSFKNTSIQIHGSNYFALISMTRPSMTTNYEKYYNYRGDVLPVGGGTFEIADVTAVFAEYEFDRLRNDLGLRSTDGVYNNDVSSVAFDIVYEIKPSGTEDADEKYSKTITLKNARISGFEQAEVIKDNNFYTVSVTFAVEAIEEKTKATAFTEYTAWS